MNLTVAMKIMGGFAIIALLLVITSSFSLINLNAIHDSTLKQSELAIPTLQGSNRLANNLTKISKLTLTAYYQTELSPLEENLTQFTNDIADFTNELTELKSVVKQEPALVENLTKVDAISEKLQLEISAVFANRKANIKHQVDLINTIDNLEEAADNVVMLLLDLSYHDLAETSLRTAVLLGENTETLLNTVVSSSLDYREILDNQSSSLVEGEILSVFIDVENSFNSILLELNKHKVTDVVDDLTPVFEQLEATLRGSRSIFILKAGQLTARQQATEYLNAAELSTGEANQILSTQVALANETASIASNLVKEKVANGNAQTIVIALVSIIAACVIAWFTLNSITRPLSKVNEMLNILASGDLSHQLDESGKDEFAQLARNCNLLIQSLRNLIQSIVSRSTQLATAAEQTSAVTAQSTSAITEQRSQVEQAASATTQMSSTSQSVLSSANDALGEIKQADDEAERIKVISARNRQTIELLANEVQEASVVINQLQQDSASIGGILDVIKGIAEQTNLLALNAAIEAARAGEQGRGFAVVADEVRTLASRTQESTQEIQNMIEALQSGASQAVSVMETGTKQAGDCVEQSEETDKALEVITHAVHEAFDRSTQIASAAEEQSTVAHEISENLESIVAISEQTTAGSQQTAESSNEVAKLAEELQQSVQEFKL